MNQKTPTFSENHKDNQFRTGLSQEDEDKDTDFYEFNPGDAISQILRKRKSLRRSRLLTVFFSITTVVLIGGGLIANSLPFRPDYVVFGFAILILLNLSIVVKVASSYIETRRLVTTESYRSLEESLKNRNIDRLDETLNAAKSELANENYQAALKKYKGYDIIFNAALRIVRNTHLKNEQSDLVQNLELVRTDIRECQCYQRVERAKDLIAEGNYEEAEWNLRAVIDEVNELSISEEKTRLRSQAQEELINARLGKMTEIIKGANSLLEDKEFEQAESEFQTALEHSKDFEHGNESLSKRAQATWDELSDELRRRAREGYKRARLMQATERLGRARDLLEEHELERARSEYQSVIDHLNGVEQDDEDISELTRTARRGYVQTWIEEAKADLRSATNHYESGDFYEAREAFESVLELLEEVREEAAEHDLEEKVDEIDDFIESGENSADRARRALVDIDREPSSSVDVPEDWGPDLIVEPPDLDFDVEPNRPFPPGVTDDLRSELPDHEILVERYGIGGNADVHKIQLVDSNEVVALKVPRWEGTLNSEIAERFVGEAQRWDRLDDDPYVVGVVDWGTQPYPWLFLEFMDGGDLSERVGDLSVQASVSVLTDICNAVQHAHRHGVVHADLKPQNVMFSTNGGEETVKVGDWGLARLLLRHSTSLEQLTPEYAAPEQVDPNGTVDVPYTDIYQVGVIAYELFTGRPPYDYENKSAVVAAKQKGETPPSPSELADVPSVVDDVVSKAMAHRKEDRYETVVNFRNDLEDVMDTI